jgi:hypothetical protein
MTDPRNTSDVESELRQFSPSPADPHARAAIEHALNAPVASMPPAYSPADRRLLTAMGMGAVAAVVIAICSLNIFQSPASPSTPESSIATGKQTTELLAALAAGQDPFRDPRAPQ